MKVENKKEIAGQVGEAISLVLLLLKTQGYSLDDSKAMVMKCAYSAKEGPKGIEVDVYLL